MLQPGTPIPSFSTTTTDGSTFSNTDCEGRNVVVFFYPADNTGGCTREACAFRDARPAFDAANTLILGVSGDDAASHRDFTERYNLNFPLLVDVEGDLCRAFDVPRDGTWAKRVTFLADRQGIIRRVWEDVHVVGHAAEVLTALSELSTLEPQG